MGPELGLGDLLPTFPVAALGQRPRRASRAVGSEIPEEEGGNPARRGAEAIPEKSHTVRKLDSQAE